jgi:hypothetical protein
VDTDSGEEGGTKEGIFSSEWKGEILYGSNEAVGGTSIYTFKTAVNDSSAYMLALVSDTQHGSYPL